MTRVCPACLKREAAPGYDGMCLSCWCDWIDEMDRPLVRLRGWLGVQWERVARVVRGWWAKP